MARQKEHTTIDECLQPKGKRVEAGGNRILMNPNAATKSYPPICLSMRSRGKGPITVHHVEGMQVSHVRMTHSHGLCTLAACGPMQGRYVVSNVDRRAADGADREKGVTHMEGTDNS